MSLESINKNIVQATDDVVDITQNIENVQANIDRNVQGVLDAFGKESGSRQKMIEAFKNITDTLKKCQQGKPLPSYIQDQFNDMDATQDAHQSQSRQLAQRIELLTNELMSTRATAAQLQQQLNDQMATKTVLADENTQLQQINDDYKIEIEQQVGLFAKLNAVMTSLKGKIQNLVKTTSTTRTTDATLYLPDTIMSDIRQDVLKGVDFQFITDHKYNSRENLVTAVQSKILDKWISQLTKTADDLQSIITNVQTYTSADDASRASIPMWQSYLEKLRAFLTMWYQKQANIVASWVVTRENYNGSVSGEQPSMHPAS